MLRYRIEDEFQTTPQRYWEVFFDRTYNDGLYRALDMDLNVLEFRREGTGDDEVIHRTMRLTPHRKLPMILRKFAEGTITYEERNQFVRRDDRMQVDTIPNYLANRFTSTGAYFLEEKAPGRINRVWEGSCECRVPIAGGKLEQLIVDEVHRSYGITTEFTRGWLREHE